MQSILRISDIWQLSNLNSSSSNRCSESVLTLYELEKNVIE